jgi:hypothetical protein
MSADPAKDAGAVHPIADYLTKTLEDVEQLDAQLHLFRDNIRARINVLQRIEDETFQKKITAAEEILAGPRGEPDPPDVLERRLASLGG